MWARPSRRSSPKIGQEVKLGTFAEAAAHGEALINATNGEASLDALALAGKILMDVANPLDISRGRPLR
jgi:hypothetical protein